MPGVGGFNISAVTWANGSTGLTGTVSPSNSLVGDQGAEFGGGGGGDQVGIGGIVPLVNGNYVVESPYWSNGSLTSVMR